MKNVLLVTQGFPYGVSEQGFLPTEYERLPEAFKLCLCAYGKAGEPGVPLSEKVTHYRYSWPEKASVLGLVRQITRPEVRRDIALFLRSQKPKRLSGVGWILLYSLRAQQVTERLRQIVREEKIDIVYTYWCVQATVAALRLKREFPALKVVTRFHGMDLYEEQLSQGWQPLRPYIAQNCDQLIFICQAGMDYFLAHWGREWADKSAVLRLGCRALPRCKPEEDPAKPLALVSCSSVIPIKRVALIADSLAALPPSVSVHWRHFGGGEWMEDLREHAAKVLDGRSNIRYTFHGPVPNAALPQAYLDAEAQLFITTSETEGLPVSMMEAFAMGIPVAATAVGGIPEMVQDGSNGFLLPADPRPGQAAEALQGYIALTAEGKRAMAQAAYETWEKEYDAEKNAEKLLSLLERLTEGERAV